MAGTPEQSRPLQQPHPEEAGVSRRKFLGIDWNLRRFGKMKPQEPQNHQQEPVGQPQPEPVFNRSQFLTGIFLAVAGAGELVVSGYTNGSYSRQRAEQHARAYRQVKEIGIHPEPDQEAVKNAQHLRATRVSAYGGTVDI